MSEIKGGAEEVRAPWYSHVTYDIVPGKEVVVRRPDVLIVEGLNVLAPARPRQDGRQGLALSDFFDFSIYVDAKTSYIEEWYVDRFRKLRSTAFAQPESYFHRYATLSDAEAEADRPGHLEAHQRAEPGGKRPSHPGPRAAGPDQGCGPFHPPHAAEEGLAQVCHDGAGPDGGRGSRAGTAARTAPSRRAFSRCLTGRVRPARPCAALHPPRRDAAPSPAAGSDAVAAAARASAAARLRVGQPSDGGAGTPAPGTPARIRAVGRGTGRQHSLTDPASPWVVVNKHRPLSPADYVPAGSGPAGACAWPSPARRRC